MFCEEIVMRFQHIICFILFITFSNSYARDNNEFGFMETDIECNSKKITATSNCIQGEIAGYQICYSQEFIFNQKDGNLIIVKSEGSLVKDEISGAYILDYIASDWTCGYFFENNFIIVKYNNGGNCLDCEFYMLYDLSGVKLTDKKSFDIVSKKIKLVKGWSKNLKRIHLNN